MSTDRTDEGRSLRWGGGIVAAATLTLLLATGPSLAIVWDEGYTLGRVARVRAWLRGLANPPRFAATMRRPTLELVLDSTPPPRFHELNTRAKLFDPKAIAWFWPFAREEPHGHPPFYAETALIGDLLTPWRADLPRARLGTMLAFSLAAGALFAFLARRYGVWAALAGAGAWVLQPRLFAHGHYASYDGLLTSLWLGAILAFAKAVEGDSSRRWPRWGWTVVFGLLAGAVAGTKLTGWFLPFPFLAWTARYRDRRAALALLVGGVVAAALLYACTPPWWADLVAGLTRFFHSNLTRHETIPITVQFLGRVYITPRQSLPWYNTLVWTLFVTPAGFLALAVLGGVRACRRPWSDRIAVLAAGHWLFLLILRALPHTPGHDGERQFLPAFGCLALVAGIGASALLTRFGPRARWLIGAALVEGIAGIALMWPVPLAYYSPLVGGLRGASALGMEATYYWDALNPDTLDWLNRHTGPDEKAAFATYPTSLIYLQRTGQLRVGVTKNEPGTFVWYVVQNRPGDFNPCDRALIQVNHPAHVVTKWGVPLVWVFPYAQLATCLDARKQHKAGAGMSDPRP